jgi:hypothetical protein
VSEEDTHRVTEYSVGELCKVCIEQEVAKRALNFPLEENKRVESPRD